MPGYFLVLLAVCAADISSSVQDTLVVLTYNIHHGEGLDGVVDPDRIASVIKSCNPDVVCLQEVDRNLPRTDHRDFPALLADKLGMQVFFEPNYQFDGGDYGNAILTRLPVSEHHNMALPNPISAEPRGCLAVTKRWQNTEIRVLNTHLGLNGQERLAQAEAIVTALENGHPTILAGDMNETAAAPGLQRLQTWLKDTIEKQTDATSGTVPVNDPRRRIDYILVSEHFDVISSTIINTEETRIASDHLPYMATLRLKTAAK